MKKYLLIVMVSILSLLLVGCNKNETVDEENLIDNAQPRDFGLDFSDYEYYGYDEEWNMNMYYTGGLDEGRWIIYYANGQIQQEGYFDELQDVWFFTGYYPTYGNYVYGWTGDYIEQYDPHPEIYTIEDEPTGWIAYIMAFKNGEEDGLTTVYDSVKDMESLESHIAYQIYNEDGAPIWIETKGKRYSIEEFEAMSMEEQNDLLSLDWDSVEKGYYHLSLDNLPFEGEVVLEEPLEEMTERYVILESLSDWEDDGEAKGYTENPVWSGDELIKRGHMTLWYPNGNLRMYTSTIGSEGDHIILDGVQTYYYENGNVGRIEIYDNDVQNGLFLVFNEDGEVTEVKYYKNGELKMDSNMPKEEWSIDASDYYSILLYNYLYCKNEWDGFPMQGERGIGRREEIATRFCKETIDTANIIGDYDGDSSLKDARINHTLGVIDFNNLSDSVDYTVVNELTDKLASVEKSFKDKYGIVE